MNTLCKVVTVIVDTCRCNNHNADEYDFMKQYMYSFLIKLSLHSHKHGYLILAQIYQFKYYVERTDLLYALCNVFLATHLMDEFGIFLLLY